MPLQENTPARWESVLADLTARRQQAQQHLETLRAEGGLADEETEGDCGAGLELYRWKQTITATEIDGLHDVEVVVENSQTGQAIYDLQTLLFEPPDDSTTNESGNRKDSKTKAKRSVAQ